MNFFNYEHRSIEPVLPDERHGVPWHLFTVWFTPNMNVAALVTGAVAIELGLNMTWAIVAIVVGNGLGCIFMAAHSAQGPKLGLPQMIQSRAQFGILGNILPSLVVVFDGIGFVALGFVIAGQSIALMTGASINEGMVIAAVVCLIIIFIGYDLIHRYQRYVAGAVGAMFLLWTIQLLRAPHIHAATPDITAGTVVLMVSIGAAWQLSWAPFVSDYSRYVPASASTKQVFWYTYLGSFTASSWGMILGAGAASVALKSFSADSLGYMIALSPAFALWILALVNFLSQVAPTALEAYTPFLTLVNMIDPFTRRSRFSGSLGRLALTAVVVIVDLGVAIWLNTAGVITTFSNFLNVLLYILAPWTAINLVDFYFLKHGRYPLADFFNPKGSFGLANWRAVAIYLFAFGVEFPFMNSALFVGPIAKYLGGADIAWIVGIVLAGALWYFTSSRESPADSVLGSIPSGPTETGLLNHTTP